MRYQLLMFLRLRYPHELEKLSLKKFETIDMTVKHLHELTVKLQATVQSFNSIDNLLLKGSPGKDHLRKRAEKMPRHKLKKN